MSLFYSTVCFCSSLLVCFMLVFKRVNISFLSCCNICGDACWGSDSEDLLVCFQGVKCQMQVLCVQWLINIQYLRLMLKWTKNRSKSTFNECECKENIQSSYSCLVIFCCQRYMLWNVALIVAAEPDLLDSCQTVFPTWLVDNGHLFIK